MLAASLGAWGASVCGCDWVSPPGSFFSSSGPKMPAYSDDAPRAARSAMGVRRCGVARLDLHRRRRMGTLQAELGGVLGALRTHAQSLFDELARNAALDQHGADETDAIGEHLAALASLEASLPTTLGLAAAHQANQARLDPLLQRIKERDTLQRDSIAQIASLRSELQALLDAADAERDARRLAFLDDLGALGVDLDDDGDEDPPYMAPIVALPGFAPIASLDRVATLAEPRQQHAAGGIGKRRKGAVQRFVLILNHMV